MKGIRNFSCVALILGLGLSTCSDRPDSITGSYIENTDDTVSLELETTDPITGETPATDSCPDNSSNLIVYDTILEDASNLYWGIATDTGYLLDKNYYYLNYNGDWKIPFWVAYYLSPSNIAGPDWTRPTYMAMDYDLPEEVRSQYDDYTNTGWNRGHNAPAADFKRTEEAYKSTFIMSNISPQNPSFNSGIWARLESEVRECVIAQNGELWIFTGNHFSTMPPNTIDNDIGIPSELFKAILCIYPEDNYHAYAFLIPNAADLTDPTTEYQMTVDELESITGYDFFCNLDDALESQIESTISEWPYRTWVPQF